MHVKHVLHCLPAACCLALICASPKFANAETLVAKGAELYHYRAVITDVYDGDTVSADVDLGFSIWLRDIRFRLAHIDAPELRGEQRPAGIRARDFLRQRLIGKPVIIKTLKDRKGKYGRYIAEIWLDGQNINQTLVENGHAVQRIY